MKSSTTKIKRQFFDSLKRGTGEVYLILKANPDIDFSDYLIKGGTINYALDQQSEGSRAKYIYGLIKRSKHKEKIVKAILNNLKNEKKDYWGLEQMCDLALLFDKDGIPEAKEALYSRFEKNNRLGYEFCGQDQLLKVDGLKGLLKVAETVGKNLNKNKDDWEDSWRVDEFQKKNKSINVYKELEKASRRNKNIQAYLKSIKENKRNPSKRTKFRKFTYELVKQKIEDNRFRIISTDRANDLSENEVKKLADDFLMEKETGKKEAYLRFFSKRQFPNGFGPIYKIATSRPPKKSRLVEFALDALRYFPDKKIRKLALDNFKTKKNPCNYLSLLASNYKKGDYKTLTDIINRSDDYDYVHSLVYGLIDIYESNPTAECSLPLVTMYSKMNCGMHRADLVRILKQNHVLPDNIRNELKFDSYESSKRIKVV
jgi:hypothetical protein